MSWNTFGRVFRFTTWGESHGPAIGAVVDGCPPGLALSEGDIQPWLDLPEVGMVGSSPEILVRLRDGQITIRPIAGTRPRGKTPEADRAAERELLADPKERAEVYKQLFDLSTKRSYLMPLIPLPAIVAHHKDVKLLGGHKNPKGFEFNRVAWN